MTVKAQVDLLAEITDGTLETDGLVDVGKLRTFLKDLVDTAEDRWGVGDLATSPAVSPQLSEAYARIEGLLADCGGGGGSISVPPGSPIVWLDPTDITKMWQDSGQTTPVTTDGDPIGYWEDSSGNGNDFTQSTAGLRPTWKTTYVQFNEDVMVGADLSANATAGTMVARITVADSDCPFGATLGGMVCFTDMNNSGSAAHYAQNEIGAHWVNFMSTSRPNAGNWADWNPTTSATKHTMVHRKAAGGTLTVRVDGTDEYSASTTTSTLGSAPLIGSTRRSGDISSFATADGRIEDGGLLLYNTELTGSDLTDAETFVETVPEPAPAATGCISPADLRGAIDPIIDLIFPVT